MAIVARSLLVAAAITAAGTFAACAQVLGIQPFQEGSAADAGGADAPVADAEGSDSGVPDGGGPDASPTCCAVAEPLAALDQGATRTVTGATTAGPSLFDVDLAASELNGFGCTGAAGPEHVYAVPMAAGGIFTAALTRGDATSGTSFDSVLHVWKDCCAPGEMVLCADRAGCGGALNGGEVVSFPVHAGDTWYVIVDGRTAADHGRYELALSLVGGDVCGAKVPVTLWTGSPLVLLGDDRSMGDDPGFSEAGLCNGVLALTSGAARQIIYDVTPGPGVTGVDYRIEHAMNTCDAGSCQGNPFDSVLYASLPASSNPCGGSDKGKVVSAVACQNNQKFGAGTDTDEAIAVDGGGEAYVFVDSAATKDCCGTTGGTYRLRLSPRYAGECADAGLGDAGPADAGPGEGGADGG